MLTNPNLSSIGKINTDGFLHVFSFVLHWILNLVFVYMFIYTKFLLYHCSEFCGAVRKIFIYTAEEVKKLSPKVLLSFGEEPKTSKLDSEAFVNADDQEQSSIVGPGC